MNNHGINANQFAINGAESSKAKKKLDYETAPLCFGEFSAHLEEQHKGKNVLMLGMNAFPS